ncbi:uncharacterized protein PAC_18208 [Phialocephala subalpina]|uniref:DUF7719 domain-containing protein n=1 Tax=Phialocephala subalpina TaxID=576137 RepID=A0A1L7XTF7_9HELO|nr:uncharacterized protein PAC_18208 [Phialocephala subalpina]
MARQRKEKNTGIRLKHPDRSGPDPSQETLLDLAAKRGLLDIPEGEGEEGTGNNGFDENGEPLVGRMGESILWSISLTMLHFTLDVLVANQYAVEIRWHNILSRTMQAFPIILLLVYSFHPHPTPSILLPLPPPRIQAIQALAHQIFFFVGSVSAGCYLIYITNMYGYYAVMKQSPPLGCLWIWSVIELNVFWATGSLICCGIFLKWGGYNFL